MSNLIAASRALGFPPIFIDFLKGAESARHLYFANSPAQVASKLDAMPYKRELIAEILREQNKRYGASEAAFKNIDKLEEASTLCVLSGQQAILFGGPLFVMIKAITLAKLAEKLSRELNRHVIPIFWIAGDDHDFEEANHIQVLTRHSEQAQVVYSKQPELPVSIAEVVFSDQAALDDAKRQLFEALGQSDFTPELQESIDKAYKLGSTFSDAFGTLIADLTKSLGVILFCPTDKRVKQHAFPLFRSLLTRQAELHQLERDTNREIIRSGYHIQAEKSEDAAHLFYELSGRMAIHTNGHGFKVGETGFSLDDLLSRIETEPEKFSPDVIIRPVLQSYLFPTVAQIAGPSEIAYLAQVNPIFNLFNLVPPYYVARSSATFVETRFAKLMEERNISFDDLTGDIEQLINRLLAETFPKDLEADWKRVADAINAQFDTFAEESLQFDPSLKEFSKQTRGKIEYQLKTFEEKLFSSHKKKSKDVRERIYRLGNTLFPNRTLQERYLNINYFIARYGFQFVQFMYDRIELNQPSHQLIPVDPAEVT